MLVTADKQIGIVSYGVQLPQYKIMGEEIARANSSLETKPYKALGVESKTVPAQDDDTITLATGSVLQAIQRAELFLSSQSSKKNTHNLDSIRKEIHSLYIGSESHPYAVKPSGSVVAQALGFSSSVLDNKPLATADLQFACKAGTQALQLAALYVSAGFGTLSCAVGVDTAQASPGDVLEYTAGAGAASFLLGSGQNKKKDLAYPVIAELQAMTSIATDTPDFWRRPKESYPQHAGRFTGKPGYFYHVELAAKKILSETGLKPEDFAYCVFHTPNSKFPKMVASKLGFAPEQLAPSLAVEKIGNTYAGASMIGLASTLDVAQPNNKILVVSYGSGAGSDAFIFQTTQQLDTYRKNIKKHGQQEAIFVSDQIEQLQPISYQEYLKNSTH